jgi:hypothetical protein
MSKYNTTYYLLILLLITGAFASMAQNNYGITIMGWVAVAFSAVFLLQGVRASVRGSADQKDNLVELYALSVICLLLALRVFYIHIMYVELVFGIAGLALIAVYLGRLYRNYRLVKPGSGYLAGMVVLFYSSMVLFLLSMIIIPFVPALSEPAGIMAFGILIFFTAVSLYKSEVIYNGEKMSAHRLAARFENRTLVLLVIFSLFSLYIGLTKIDVIPQIYTDEFPQAYFELVNRAESGNETPVDGRFDHERFKEQYDQFVRRHIDTLNQ